MEGQSASSSAAVERVVQRPEGRSWVVPIDGVQLTTSCPGMDSPLSARREPRSTASPRFSIGERGSQAGSLPRNGPGLPVVRGELGEVLGGVAAIATSIIRLLSLIRFAFAQLHQTLTGNPVPFPPPPRPLRQCNSANPRFVTRHSAS